MTDTDTRPAELGGADRRLYVRIAATVRQQIADGVLTAGSALSDSALAEEHKSTRQTCGKALRILLREGLIVRVQGRGCFEVKGTTGVRGKPGPRGGRAVREERVMIETASVRLRMLGGVLRAYRDISGLGLEGAADILECDRSKISRVENGVRGIRPKEVRELLAEYGVSEQERDALAAIARIGAAVGWWQDHADVLTRIDREYLQLEAIAHRVEVYEPELVPALLQTPGYAQAVAGSAHSGGLAALTQARQRELFGEHGSTGQRGPELAVLLDEAVLYRMVGGPGLMRAQLLDLARAARGDVPLVTVRVLSFSGGAGAVGAGGPVTILRFADAPRAGVVYLPRPGPGGTCLVGQDDLTAYTRTLAALTKAALSPARSAKVIRDVAATYDEPDTDPTGTSTRQEDDRAGALA